MEMSAPPPLIRPPSVADLESSSKEEETSLPADRRQPRILFNNRYVISTTSSTITFTTYSFTTTTYTTSVTLGSSTAIGCLPSGITIC